MLDSMSKPPNRRWRFLAAVGTFFAALLFCSFLVPLHSTAFGDSQTGSSAGPKAVLWPISIDYPQDGSIFPPGITPPTFLWRDAAADSWQIEIAFADNSAPFHVSPKAERMRLGAIDPECISNTNEIPQADSTAGRLVGMDSRRGHMASHTIAYLGVAGYCHHHRL